MKIIKSLFCIVLILELLPVKASDGTFDLIGEAKGTTYVPLLLSIQGNGEIVPFKNGQMLVVGHEYEMTAVPNRGYEFAYWSPVSVFTDTEVIYGGNNLPFETNSSVTISVSQRRIQIRSLHFSMQPVQVLIDLPGIRTLTATQGWQATFIKGGRVLGNDERAE